MEQISLKERSEAFSEMVATKGWELLQRSFRPEIRTRITDSDAQPAFLYEAIRAQLIQEIFSAPQLVIKQAEREWARVNQTPEKSGLWRCGVSER